MNSSQNFSRQSSDDSSEEECCLTQMRRIQEESQHKHCYHEETRRRRDWEQNFQQKEERIRSMRLYPEDAARMEQELDRQWDYENHYRKSWNTWFRGRYEQLKQHKAVQHPRYPEEREQRSFQEQEHPREARARQYNWDDEQPIEPNYYKKEGVTDVQPEPKGWEQGGGYGFQERDQPKTRYENDGFDFYREGTTPSDYRKRTPLQRKRKNESTEQSSPNERPPKRKQKKAKQSFFDPHLSPAEVEAKIKTGELFVAIARFHETIKQLVFCREEGGERVDYGNETVITTARNLNRCLHGDKIAVELLPESEWQVAPNQDETENGEPLKLRKVGKVVAIIERKQHNILGCFRVNKVKDSGEQMVKKNGQPYISFFPSHHYYPIMDVEVPSEVAADPAKFEKVKYLVEILNWPIEHKRPQGLLKKRIGTSEEIGPETESILIENLIDYSPFPLELTEEFTEEITITEEDIKERRDLRAHRVFTIDPVTARDLDDACHVVPLPNGNFEVGVHIADVSHYVKPGTDLDAIARARTTSVYLVNRVIPMLPHILSQTLCSLNPGVDRFACSIIWELTPEGEIKDQWVGKTIIKSVAKLSYEHAQKVIQDFDVGIEEMKDLIIERDPREVGGDIIILQKISAQLRAKRFENGALSLGNRSKLSFQLDDNDNPISFKLTHARESNQLIEEFMLLANMRIAKFIFEQFPENAVLRRHEEPIERKMLAFKKFCAAMNLDEIDDTNSKAFNASLQNAPLKYPHLAGLTEVIAELATRSMQQAKYFCAVQYREEAFHHYALNEPFYTHFTSPIRRYPDIIVHRLVWAAVKRQAALSVLEPPADQTDPPPGGEPIFNVKAYGVETSDTLQEIVELCNERKATARRASMLSNNLFLAVYVKFRPVTDPNCIVYQLEKSKFIFYSPLLGLSEMVYIGTQTHSAILADNTLTIAPRFCPTCNGVWHLSNKQQPIDCTHQPVEKVEVIPLKITLFSKVTIEITMRKKTSPPSFRAELVHEFAKGEKVEPLEADDLQLLGE